MLLIVHAAVGCDSPTQSSVGSVLLDRETVADVFGDKNGAASSDELLGVDDFFETNGEAWCVSSLPWQLWKSDEATADDVKACFASMATRPFLSEHALRQAYEGINIKTPYVSIVVLQNRQQLRVTKFFRSAGPGISSARWDVLIVK